MNQISTSGTNVENLCKFLRITQLGKNLIAMPIFLSLKCLNLLVGVINNYGRFSRDQKPVMCFYKNQVFLTKECIYRSGIARVLFRFLTQKLKILYIQSSFVCHVCTSLKYNLFQDTPPSVTWSEFSGKACESSRKLMLSYDV